MWREPGRGVREGGREEQGGRSREGGGGREEQGGRSRDFLLVVFLVSTYTGYTVANHVRRASFDRATTSDCWPGENACHAEGKPNFLA